MAITLATNPKTITSETLELNIVAAPIAKAQNNQLVARWFVDENSKLYCQWMIKD